jgi:phosphate transport system substrate-binding protein
MDAAAGVDLFGAGATFPQPLYDRMFSTYERQSGIKIQYEGSGSGAGIERIIKKQVDFAGTDAFMTEKELKEAGASIIHIPTCLGAVVMTYNLPGNPRLRFTAEAIADIFLGKIRRWSDPKMAEINPGVKLPDMPITAVHRSDGSGTTFIFSEYLSKVNKEWKEKIGTGKSLHWPAGLAAAKGNPGVAGLVKQISGAIGYVELVYGLGNDLTVAAFKNRAGQFVDPTPESVSRSADVNLPDDTNISLTDTLAPVGYPISSFTWLALYREQGYGGRSREKTEELARLLWWVVHDGQRFAKLLHYSPLPEEAARKAETLLRALTFNGLQLIK